jgi:hypothetical protein
MLKSCRRHHSTVGFNRRIEITWLHLYHDTIVSILCWISFKYNAMLPIIRLFLLMNIALHMIMYSYYALSSLGPKIRRHLRCKIYITQFEILRFIILGAYGIVLFYKQTGYLMDWFYFVVGQNPLFFYMFYDFYIKSYRKKSNSKDYWIQFYW